MEDTSVNAANADPAKTVPAWQTRHTRLLGVIDEAQSKTSSESRQARLSKLAAVLRDIEDVIQGLSQEDAGHHIKRLTALQQNCMQAVHHESHDDTHLDHVIQHASAFMRSISQGAKEEMANDGDASVDANPSNSAVVLRQNRNIHADRIPPRTTQYNGGRRNSGRRAPHAVIEGSESQHEGKIVPLFKEKH